jgi:hypothetical protein
VVNAVPGWATPVGTALLLATALGVGSADSTSRHVPITEFAVGAMLGDPNDQDAVVAVQYALGDLRRVGQKTLLGGEVALALNESGEHVGSLLSLRPRVRREIGNGWAVDLAAGLIVAGSEDGQPIDGVGFSTAVGIGRGSLGLSAEVATRRLGAAAYPYGGQRVTTTQLGLRIGGGAGILAGIGLPALYMVVGGLIFG